MSKKQIFRSIRIENMTNIGAGVGKLPDGRVVFVKNGVTGDVLDIEIIKETAAYSVAAICGAEIESEYRVRNLCEPYKRCGGCVFRWRPTEVTQLSEAKISTVQLN